MNGCHNRISKKVQTTLHHCCTVYFAWIQRSRTPHNILRWFCFSYSIKWIGAPFKCEKYKNTNGAACNRRNAVAIFFNSINHWTTNNLHSLRHLRKYNNCWVNSKPNCVLIVFRFNWFSFFGKFCSMTKKLCVLYYAFSIDVIYNLITQFGSKNNPYNRSVLEGD